MITSRIYSTVYTSSTHNRNISNGNCPSIFDKLNERMVLSSYWFILVATYKEPSLFFILSCLLSIISKYQRIYNIYYTNIYYPVQMISKFPISNISIWWVSPWQTQCMWDKRDHCTLAKRLSLNFSLFDLQAVIFKNSEEEKGMALML